MTPQSADLRYLESALRRAGLTQRLIDVSSDLLSGGRTGAETRLLSASFEDGSSASYALKVLPARTWRDDAMEQAAGGEYALWQSGATRDLPGPLVCPTIDVSRDDEGRWWMLMHDISAKIRKRGWFDDQDEERLMRSIAALHAHYWDSPKLADLPLATVAGTTRIWAEGALATVNGLEGRPSWVADFLESFTPMAVLLPAFLELLDPSDADFYLALCADRSWLAGLDAGPQTMVHGDLRRANIGFDDDHLTLIDWEFAARAPAATDLAWHWFLHFWAYPPDDRPLDPQPLLDPYLNALESALGRGVDRKAFDQAFLLAWPRVLCQIGCCLSDEAIGANDATRNFAKARARSAIERARRAVGA